MSEDLGFEFSRNENVMIAVDAPKKFRPSAHAWMISGRKLETERQSFAAGYSVGTVLYLVEYIDGSSVEMSEEYISRR